jgi:hypothetical protein
VRRMPGIPITFAEAIVPMVSERDRRRADTALRRIAIGVLPGRWRERPSAIVVTGALTDGRSGTLVLRIEVHWGTQRLSRIAKISSLDEARAEWEAYTGILQQVPSVLCPPVEAVTEGVLDPGDAPPGEDEAVVYTDVDQFAGAPAANLENLVATAAAGESGPIGTAVAVISRLLGLAGSVFYNQCKMTADAVDRKDANHSLGPDLQLAADHIEAGAGSAAGRHPGRSARRISPPDVLAAALELPEAGDSSDGADEPRAGSVIALSRLRLRPAGNRLIGERDYVSVEIQPGAGHIELMTQAASEPQYSVYGTVTGTRSALTWQRIRNVLPEIRTVGDGVVQVGEGQLAHPFAVLHQLLTQPVAGLVTSTVHGDLNPRNVLIADGQPFLIDYARARRDQPLLGDFAWLEINLLRYPLSTALSLADLVEAERLLALADRVADLLSDDQREVVDSALARLADPRLCASIRILGAIRRHARQTYARAEAAAGESAQPWWREYAAQLLLAAQRTFKWAGDLQPEAGLRAAVAAAAVASEQLAYPDNPWRLWNHQRLAAATGAILPLLPDREAALPVLASLVRGLDPLGADPELGDEIERTRARIASSAMDLSPRRMVELRDSHDLYIDLPASVLEPSAAGSGQRPSASAVTSVMDTAQAVVLGASGTGKTALLEELEFRLADGPFGRFPVRIRASDVAEVMTRAGDSGANDTILPLLAGRIPVAGPERAPLLAFLASGAVHLMVDDFDKVPTAGRPAVAGWLGRIRKRFPHTPVIVCHRGAEVPSELAGWTGIALGEPSDEQIAGYLARFGAFRDLSASRTAALITAVSERGLRELARTPLLLWLLASTGNEPKPPVTAGDLADTYIRRLESRSADGGQWSRCAEALAGWQTARAENATRDDLFLAATEPDVTAVWNSAREQLIQLDILVPAGPASRFRLQIYRDYFAARYLVAVAEASPERLSSLVLSFSWRNAFALLASFASARPDVVGGLVSAVAEADPCYAARLLRSSASPLTDLAGRFLARQEQVLRSRQSGQVAQARAAQALAEAGSPAAFRHLFSVLCDPEAGQAASELSLTALVSAQLATRPDSRRHRGVAAQLVVRLGPVMERAEPPLLTAILRAVGDLELRGLELRVADYLRRPVPWPVARDAKAALDKLGVLLPAELAGEFQQAQEARLAEVEGELPEVTASAEANKLQAERYLLLSGRHGPGALPGMLERRFAFEIGASLAEPIDEAAERAQTGQTAGDGGWQAIMNDPALAPDELLAAIAGSDELAAATAAHRLLRDRPDLAGRLFRVLAENRPARRSLIAAAAAAKLPADQLPEVADYFRRLLASGQDDGTSLESLAAVAQVIYAKDAQTGVRLVREAHRLLTDSQRADRLHWPWSSALTRFGGTPAQLDTLLSADLADGHQAALDALAGSSFLLTAGRAPGHRFSDAARHRLLSACRDATAGSTVMLLLAAAAMSAPEALDALFGAEDGPSLAAAVDEFDANAAHTLSFGKYGPVEVAPAADALAAIGYLGRLGWNASAVASAGYRLLREFDTSGHPSVATGRLIGLGYLGDWRPVLDALGSADPRLPAIARNVVELWIPGPQTAPGYADSASVAHAIAVMLADPGLSPGRRSVLLELKQSAEERAGALTPALDHVGYR